MAPETREQPAPWPRPRLAPQPRYPLGRYALGRAPLGLALRVGPAAAASVAALLLLAPADSRAFDVFGDSLDLRQRDFRVFNNFAGPQANDNVVPNPDFPGSLGAELAIRKAVAEWGSRERSRTDPLQDRIGDGGANFDSYFAGRATSPGGTNDNVVSALPGSSFVLAFTELPIGDGWRIQFYDGTQTWDDGPGTPMGALDAWDIQGVMTHEYGHALGLDHSAVPGATMLAGAGNQRGVDQRSIEADDIAGVQFLYGASAPTKPVIEGYTLSGTTLVLRGTHLDPFENDVWFTPAGQGDGNPLTVLDVPSPDGETLTLTVPPGAGPGDILVKVPGTGGQHLSNAFPFDPTRDPWTPPRAFGPAGTSSVGSTLELELVGLPSATAGSLRFDVRGGGIAGTAILFSGPVAARETGRFGELLVGGPWRRDGAAGLFIGGATLDVPIGPQDVGTRRYFQALVLDPGLPSGGALTAAIEVEIVD